MHLYCTEIVSNTEICDHCERILWNILIKLVYLQYEFSPQFCCLVPIFYVPFLLSEGSALSVPNVRSLLTVCLYCSNLGTSCKLFTNVLLTRYSSKEHQIDWSSQENMTKSGERYHVRRTWLSQENSTKSGERDQIWRKWQSLEIMTMSKECDQFSKTWIDQENCSNSSLPLTVVTIWTIVSSNCNNYKNFSKCSNDIK